LAIKTDGSQQLYTGNAGGRRSQGLPLRKQVLDHRDTESELLQVDKYLQTQGITVIEKTDGELTKMLKEKLTMTGA
jgi:hypothetical protein